MIEIIGLEKSYGHNQVLRGLNMTVGDGDVYGFIGENGAGKTTTMNIICSLLGYGGGTVKVGGADIAGGGRFSLGYLPENPSFYSYMNAFEYLAFIGASARWHGDVAARSREVLELVGLPGAASRRVSSYSRGMRQRLGIAAAIFANPDVVILDEPTSALDPQGRDDVIDIIQHLKDMGKTVVLSTHILSDVERVATRVGIIHGGVLVQEDSLQGLLSRFAANMVHVELAEVPGELVGALTALPFVTGVRQAGHWLEVGVSAPLPGSNRQLFDFLSARQAEVLSYQVHKTTLEEVYMKAVNG